MAVSCSGAASVSARRRAVVAASAWISHIVNLIRETRKSLQLLAKRGMILAMSENSHEERLNFRKENSNKWIINMNYMVKDIGARVVDFSALDPFKIGEYIRNIEEYVIEMDPIKDKLFIDIGSGVESLAHEAAGKLGALIINLDIAESAVKFLRDKNQESGIVGDAFNLPFADEFIDGVISSNFTNSSVVHEGNGKRAENMRDFLTGSSSYSKTQWALRSIKFWRQRRSARNLDTIVR